MSEDVDTALGARYRLVERIGRGATGEVWRAVDRRTDEPVAAKILRDEHVEDAELVQRFLRERAILVGLRDENIVAVRDLVVEGDRIAIVMEYVEGGSLRGVLKSGPLTPALALAVVARVLDGLAAAHERRVLHRDVKPDNVLLTPTWRELDPGTVKLSDFGIGRIIADRPSASTGLVGTPEYMAPEQLLTGTADLPGDVYGAGILLYEALAGRTPYAGDGTGYTVAHRHVTSLPPRLEVPDPLWDIIDALLDKDPARRPTARMAANQLRRLYGSVGELAALPAQTMPERFEAAGGQATEVRGLEKPTGTGSGSTLAPESPAAASAGPVEPVPMPELGPSSSETMLRPLPVLPAPAPVAATAIEEAPGRRQRWRMIALITAGALLITGGVFWLARGLFTPKPPDLPPATVFKASQQSQDLPTGLRISRVATWSAETRSADVTITYTAGKAALSGPFLESLPNPSGTPGCPALEWTAGTAALNRPTVTGVQAVCGWAVTTPVIKAGQSATVTATVGLALTGNASAGSDPGSTDPTSALQTWLDAAAKTTDAAVANDQLTSTSYPAQRLTGIDLVAPSRTVSGRPLRLTLVPVWPNGPDQLNPIMVSPPTGQASSVLVSIAGGFSGVRFTDGCSGALSVSGNGLVVTAQSLADDCTVNGRVGNFTDLTSNTFTVSTRGS